MTARQLTSRGFAAHDWINGGTAYGGRMRVYESSSAMAPRIWLTVLQADGESATLHMSLDAARDLVADLSDLIEHHYQLAEEPS